MKSQRADKRPAPDATNKAEEPKYGDFLLVDLLRPDFRHFFSRYRTDLIGFCIVSAIIAFIILATKWLAMLGATGQAGAG